MLYPCTIKDKHDKVKRIYSSKQLSKRHWNEFSFKLRLNPRKNTVLPTSIMFIKDVDVYYNFYLP